MVKSDRSRPEEERENPSLRCCRLGTLTYTLSFELGVKVTA